MLLDYQIKEDEMGGAYSRRGNYNIGCFKKNFTSLKEYINLSRGHV
jgi:hypothetical protein